MLTVTAQEYQRHIGKYHQIAMREPITITRHNRPAMMISPVDWFEQQSARIDSDVTDDEIQAMFTPERLAHIDRAREEVRMGKFYTTAQMRNHFAEKSKSWAGS